MYYQALVNKKYKIREEMFLTRTLVTIKNMDEKEIQIEKKTYEAYLKLKDFLYQQENIEIDIVAGYENISEKEEHQTGLCIDFSIKEGKKSYENITPHLTNFGFIERYPKGKEKVTGHDYCPWHIRYVGAELAKKLEKETKTLEEYYEDLSGVLIINKEKDMTSRDVVNIVGKYLYTKKVGHTGTLDPLATGVLVLTIGTATRISEMLTSTYKEYIATAKLGIKTDTLDITGKIVKESLPPKNLCLEEKIKSFKKTYIQEVPLYSAVKVKGKKLYEYARENKEVTLPKKEVTIKEIELLKQEKDTFTFRTIVSKGCYIRSLIRDIASSLNIDATMTELIRTKQGHFSIKESSTIEDIKTGNIHLLPIEQALPYPKIIVDSNEEQKVKNGAFLKNPNKIIGPCLILNKKDHLLAIYEGREEKIIAKKVLTNRKE